MVSFVINSIGFNYEIITKSLANTCSLTFCDKINNLDLPPPILKIGVPKTDFSKITKVDLNGKCNFACDNSLKIIVLYIYSPIILSAVTASSYEKGLSLVSNVIYKFFPGINPFL